MKNTDYTLDRKVIDQLDKLDDIIQERDFNANMAFISRLLNGNIFEMVFGGKDDDYIGMAFHSLSVLATSNRVDEPVKKRVIEIVNQALLGINAISVAKALADDVREFASKLDERGVNESSQIWWFADGGLAVQDLKPIVQKYVPTSARLFDWDREIVLISQGLSGSAVGAVPSKTKSKPAADLPKPGTYVLNREQKADYYEQLTVEDTYEVEDVVPTLEYCYESYEALADALQYWVDHTRRRRADSVFIFDLNEELSVINRILEAMQESDSKTGYAHAAVEHALDFLTGSTMKDDGDTAEDDESHTFRRESIVRCEALMNLGPG